MFFLFFHGKLVQKFDAGKRKKSMIALELAAIQFIATLEHLLESARQLGYFPAM